MSVTYPEYPSTNFPDSLDKWEPMSDVTEDTLTLVNKYKEYCEAGNFVEAQQILNNNSVLRNMLLDANKINQMQDAIMAIEQMWNKDVQYYLNQLTTIESSAQAVSVYTDEYDASTGVHNFIGVGPNGKVKISGPFSANFVLMVNGVEFPKYMGADNYTGGDDYSGRWMTFVFDGESVNFNQGGGLSLKKLSSATATSPRVIKGDTFYAGGSKTLKTGTLPEYADANVPYDDSGNVVSSAWGNEEIWVPIKRGAYTHSSPDVVVTKSSIADAIGLASQQSKMLTTARVLGFNGTIETFENSYVWVTADKLGEERVITDFAGKYVKGAQTIAAITATNFVPSNIVKGKTINIKSGNKIIGSVTGTGVVPGSVALVLVLKYLPRGTDGSVEETLSHVVKRYNGSYFSSGGKCLKAGKYDISYYAYCAAEGSNTYSIIDAAVGSKTFSVTTEGDNPTREITTIENGVSLSVGALPKISGSYKASGSGSDNRLIAVMTLVYRGE